MRYLFLFGLITLTCCTGSSKVAFVEYEMALQNLHAQVVAIEGRQHSTQAELEILEGRLDREIEQTKEQSLAASRELVDRVSARQDSLNSNVARLTERQSQAMTDLRTLGKECERQKSALAAVEKQSNARIARLSETMQSIVDLAEKMQSQGELIYEVKSGDTLGEIAQAHGIKVAEIRRLNSIEGDQIFPGQTLRVR